MFQTVQTFTICHPSRKCAAPGFVKCACDGNGTQCGAHYLAPVRHEDYPTSASHPNFSERRAARAAYVPPVCGPETVCPGAAAPAPTTEPEPEFDGSEFGYTVGEDRDTRLESRMDWISAEEAAAIMAEPQELTPWALAFQEMAERGYTERARVGSCVRPREYGTILFVESVGEYIVAWDSGRNETVREADISPLGYMAPDPVRVTVLDRRTGRAQYEMVEVPHVLEDVIVSATADGGMRFEPIWNTAKGV